MSISYEEAALQRCYHKNAPLKIPLSPQESTQDEVRPQQIRRAALLKSHSNTGAPRQTNPKKHLPKERPQRIAPAYIQKPKLILRQFQRNFKNTLIHFLCQVVSVSLFSKTNCKN